MQGRLWALATSFPRQALAAGKLLEQFIFYVTVAPSPASLFPLPNGLVPNLTEHALTICRLAQNQWKSFRWGLLNPWVLE
jgi:hypothetical protein